MTAHIVLDQVSVDYPIYGASGRSFRSALISAGTGGAIRRENNRINVRALNNISLEIREGDRIGLVGHNGAGKTTLLRVLGGVYEPSQGVVRIDGRISPMFDLALGINLDASGYENIRLRALLLGLDRDYLNRHIDEIAETTGLGAYLHMPVRTYSTGMLLRLTFAIATSVTPDILLMDEWINTGDEEFIAESHKRLSSLVDRSKILVLATHEHDIMRDVCNRIIVLEHGNVLHEGTPAEILGPRT